MNAKLKDIIARIDTWPAPAQDQLAQIALEIEAELDKPYEATADELAAIDRCLRDASEGRFATDEQVEALFEKYRGP